MPCPHPPWLRAEPAVPCAELPPLERADVPGARRAGAAQGERGETHGQPGEERNRGEFISAGERASRASRGASSPAGPRGWGSPGGFSGSSCPAAPLPGLSPAPGGWREPAVPGGGPGPGGPGFPVPAEPCDGHVGGGSAPAPGGGTPGPGRSGPVPSPVPGPPCPGAASAASLAVAAPRAGEPCGRLGSAHVVPRPGGAQRAAPGRGGRGRPAGKGRAGTREPRRAGVGARCSWASALLFPGGGRRAGSSGWESAEPPAVRGKRPGHGAVSGFSRAAGGREGSRAFLPAARTSAALGPGRCKALPSRVPSFPRQCWYHCCIPRQPAGFPTSASVPPVRWGRGMRCPLQGPCGLWEDGDQRCEIGSVRSQKVTHPTWGVSGCTLQTSEVFLADVFQSHEEDDRKVRRREKNRVAAQRSRKKQTQKADKLHEVNGCLEFCRHGLGTKRGTLQ